MERDPLLRLAALIVRTFRTFSAIRGLGDAHSIPGLGLSASGRLGGFHTVLIRLLNGGITRVRIVGRFRAGVGLCGGHSTWRLLRRSHCASIRIDSNGTLTIAANGLAEPGCDAIGKDI